MSPLCFSRQTRSSLSLVLCALMLFTGCQPVQPVFFHEDGDLSHYMNVATEIEYPDTQEQVLDEVTDARAPLTVANAEDFEYWDITLEEVTRITLENSQVMRQLGGRVSDAGQNIATSAPQTLTQSASSIGTPNATTTYDPALVETGVGTNDGTSFTGTGVEAALAEFDAQLDSSITWNYNDRPQNFGLASLPTFFARNFRQDLGVQTTGITKKTANGGQFEIRNNTRYEQNNNGSRTQPSDWFTNIEAAGTIPLLQGRGTQYNRIAGVQTFQQAASGQLNNIDGVMIARIRHDVTLADFQRGVRQLMSDVEDAYWELFFSYRNLESRKIGRDSALETWRTLKSLQEAGSEGGEADKEAQARSQYFSFRNQVEVALTDVFRVENRLRYMMGLSASDGRLMRPIDKPTTAQVIFDWATINAESLARRPEVRRQKWQVKRRELELIASRNNLLPRLDLSGRYRWLGAGDNLLRSSPNGIPPFQTGSNAVETLLDGNYQEWQIDLQFTMPIGFRKALSGVRHQQLLLARERAILQDVELEVSHQLSDALRDLALNYRTVQTNFNRRSASNDEVKAVNAIYDSGTITLNTLLQSQQRQADSESAFYRSLVDYNRAIKNVHKQKGSLLEYNGIHLAEGPWSGKAQFDALRRARQRDASHQINYGYTRPSVISRGPEQQFTAPPATPQFAPMIEQPAAVEELPATNETPQGSGPAETKGNRGFEEAIPTPKPDPTAALPPASSAALLAGQASGLNYAISGANGPNAANQNTVLQAGHVQPLPPAALPTTPHPATVLPATAPTSGNVVPAGHNLPGATGEQVGAQTQSPQNAKYSN